MNRFNKYLTKSNDWHHNIDDEARKGFFTVPVTGMSSFELSEDILREMFKDLVNTVKPYKSTWHRNRDLMQLLPGVANLLLGAAALVFCGYYIVFAPFHLLYKKFKGEEDNVISTYLFHSIGNVSFSLLTLIRGITLTATSPLTLLRVPLRLAITKYIGAPLIEDNKGLQKLAVMASQNDLSTATHSVIQRTLLHKCMKALSHAQHTNLPEIAEGVRNNHIDYKLFLRPKGASVAPVVSEYANSERTIKI